jgi:monothiol glutaredoxin
MENQEKTQEQEVLERIDQQVKNNPVVLYMKGTPQMPQCGFSSRAAAALVETGEKFAFVNVIADPLIFEHLPKYQDWPTFPQLYIDGELQGGCDITLELAESGELKKMMAEANAKHEAKQAEAENA